MKKIVIVLICLSLAMSFGGTKGSKKLLTIHTAKTLKSGEFALTSGMNFFTKAFAQTKRVNVDAFNFWQLDGDIAMSYGIMENLDLTIATRIYQDTQQENNNKPAYINVDAKYGNIELNGRSLIMSGNLGLQFGTAEVYDIQFEDYFSEGMTVFPEVIFSYFTDEYLPERNLSLHASLGFKMHFDNGNTFKRPENGFIYGKNKENTSSLNFSLGMVYPLDKVDIIAEIDGYSFINEPAEFLHAREIRIVNNLAFRYKFSTFLSFDFGFGYNLVTGEETTKYRTSPGTALLNAEESYSAWRGFLGVNIAFGSDGYSATTQRIEIERNEFKKKVQTFETLIKEQQNNELIQKELDNLKKEREKAEKELEELKKILEDDKK